MNSLFFRRPLLGAGIALAAMALGVAAVLVVPSSSPRSSSPSGAAAAPTPVSVAVVEQRNIVLWDEFSGRLEAVERVEVRSRVAGAVEAVHFREGALVAQGDLLITIDPAPYAAEVDRAEAQVASAQARLALARSEFDRGRQLWDSRTVSQRDLDQRLNAQREAEASLRAAQAAVQSARLNLGYTEVRAPVAGRVGRLEITTGNLVPAGPGAPVLTTLVSVDPIYASFNADEEIVMRALTTLGADANAHTELDRIPVRMVTATSNGTTFEGRLQLIDNQVDARSGTVRVRAVFANRNGGLMPGQFARLQMGQAKTEPAVMVNERAIGTDQNKKFVMVVGGDNKAAYREVTLGAFVDGLRVVTNGLKPGERIIVNGLQRVRPGAPVAPELVAMAARTAPTSAEIVQR
jgi:membrane fusion protein, multidrug efflux system